MANAGGAALGKEVGDVARHGEGQEPGCTIVIDRVAQVLVLGTSTVSLQDVFGRQTGEEVVKVRGGVVFDAKIICD